MVEPKSVQFPVLLTPQQYAWLKGESLKRDVSMGSVVRELVDKAGAAPPPPATH